jgi:hypothetical protein
MYKKREKKVNTMLLYDFFASNVAIGDVAKKHSFTRTGLRKAIKAHAERMLSRVNGYQHPGDTIRANANKWLAVYNAYMKKHFPDMPIESAVTPIKSLFEEAMICQPDNVKQELRNRLENTLG